MQTNRPPNVLLLHCHDLGRHLNLYGATSVRSPHLDHLATQGIVCEAMFAAAPQCSPSRASLFTGRWPHANGVMGLTHKTFGWDLHPAEQHLAGRLKSAGYSTELIGVHHESRVRPDLEIATALGFDRVRTGGLAGEVAAEAQLSLNRLADRANPFYLQVGFREPHRIPGKRDAPGVMGFLGDHLKPDSSRGTEIPSYLRDTASAREEISELQGAITFMDDAVGRILGALNDLGIADNTVTIFTTDHGLALPRAKCSLYDPGLEVAFIIRWPHRGWTGGRRISAMLSNIDVVPTLLDALGFPTTGRPMHGRSFCSLLDDKPYQASDQVFGEITYHDYYDPRRSVRTDRFKLIINFSSAPGFMDPSQSWGRRCSPVDVDHPHESTHPLLELYDLVSDPFELIDIAAEPRYSDVIADLTRRLAGWMSQTGDPLLDGAVLSPLHQASLDKLRSTSPPEPVCRRAPDGVAE